MKLFFHHIFIALKMEGTSLSSRLSLRPSVNRTNLALVQCQMAQTQPRRCCLPGWLSCWWHGASITRGTGVMTRGGRWSFNKRYPPSYRAGHMALAPPRFEMLGFHPHKPGGVGSGVGVLGLREHREGNSPAVPHSAPIRHHEPRKKSLFLSLVIAL